MRRFTFLSLLSGKRFYFSSQDAELFAQLYGRRPDSASEKPHTSLGRGGSVASCMHSSWARALEELSAQIYVAPNADVSHDSVNRAMESLMKPLLQPTNRRASFCLHFWMTALNVWKHAGKGRDIRGAALLGTVLYMSDRHNVILQQLRDEQWLIGACHILGPEKDTRSALRLCTVFTLSSAVTDQLFPTQAVQCMRQLASQLLDAVGEQSDSDLSLEFKVFLCALDAPLIPKRWQAFLFGTPSPTLVSAKEDLPPALTLHMAKQYEAEGNWRAIRRLWTTSKSREEACEGFRLFRLSAFLGEMLLFMPNIGTQLQLDLVRTFGTSLSFKALTNAATNQKCLANVLSVLGRMEGSEAYFSVRQVLFHRHPDEWLTFQQQHGDLFTGERSTSWETALRSMCDHLMRGDMRWRQSVPTVLRLLSDAGKNALFFKLLLESHLDGGHLSLMTVSALGQAIRRSGQWWRALDVMDGLVSCDLPCSKADDSFLEDACLQTVYALRDAKRWKEALSFYTAFASIVSPATHRVLCSVVCGMPSSAPWEAALKLIQCSAEVPEKFLMTLLCSRDPEQVFSSSSNEKRSGNENGYHRIRRYMLQGLAEGGHWQRALFLVAQSGEGAADLNLCVSLLRAGQRAEVGSLPCNFFDLLPEDLWRRSELLRLCVLVAEGHGLIRELQVALKTHLMDHSVVAQFNSLVQFLIDGYPPCPNVVFTDKYVIYRMLMSPPKSPEPIKIRVQIPGHYPELSATASRRELSTFVHSHFKLHPSCALSHALGDGHNIFTLQSVAPEGSLLDDSTLMAVQEEVIVAYKPVGVSTHGYARSVVQRAQVGAMYLPAYLLAPTSSGLILLVTSAIPTKAVLLEMRALLRIVPMVPTPLPLLSTNFFLTFGMKVLDGPGADASVVVEAVCCSDTDGLIAGSLYRLREDMTAEGWAMCGGEPDEAEVGERLYLKEVTVRLYHRGHGMEPLRFTTSGAPSWAHLTPSAQ
uniref:Uncharacterized protein n=1 Tax=Trypanosoma vivax (strain Y486) TaxID=1055687 RepID=G0TSX5_TRYVY|nr:conserved hypothetical protein, fragment [Trypanosoma vivax Y486]